GGRPRTPGVSRRPGGRARRRTALRIPATLYDSSLTAGENLPPDAGRTPAVQRRWRRRPQSPARRQPAPEFLCPATGTTPVFRSYQNRRRRSAAARGHAPGTLTTSALRRGCVAP